MKQAGVVASPISNAKQPARARPENTAALKDAPEIRGSRPRDTLTPSTGTPPSLSNLFITHSPKLSAIASTAGGVRSTVRPFSPSTATPRTSEPFWSLLILSISSSTTTSLNFAVLEDFTWIALVKRNENEKVRLVLNGFVTGEDGKPFFRALRCRGSESVEVEDIDFGGVGAPLQLVCLKTFWGEVWGR